MPSLHRDIIKTMGYAVGLAVSLAAMTFIFGWSTVEEIPSVLQPYRSIISAVQPYLAYVQAMLVFAFGYFGIKTFSGMVYAYLRRRTDHPTAATIRTITRIAGIALLLSLTASVFNVNPAAALTVGSFGGLVVGFATQTILSHVVAGVFLLLTRPFTFGDVITVSGQTGTVKEVKLMHLILEAEDGAKEILIPSSTVVTQIIHKKTPSVKTTHVHTVLTLQPPPRTVTAGAPVTITGNLREAESETPVPNATINLYDRDWRLDDRLASGKTDPDGRFSMTWIARQTDRWDDYTELYVLFDGTDVHRRSASKPYTIELTSKTTIPSGPMAD
jgi:hypothetical protein